MTRRCVLLLAALLSVLPGIARAIEGEREFFPAVATESERLTVHGATDIEAMRPLLRDFQALNPHTAILYVDYVTNDLFREAQEACRAGISNADILLSSSVDQLVRLANDGCGQAHRSRATAAVPYWANWRDEVFGFTFEPVVFAYDSRSVPPEDVPHSRDELSDLLRRKPDAYRGRIATYDIQASGIGYLLAFYDSRQAPTSNGRLLETLSRAETVIRCCNNEVLGELAAGRVSIAYNILGSYAYAAARSNPYLRIVLPRDYSLILSRGVLIPAAAPHPALAQRFLDYLLSPRGRQVARDESFFFTEDGPLPPGVDGPAALMASGVGRPIRIGPALLAAQDEIQRRSFIEDWHRHMTERDRDAPLPAPAPAR